MQLKRTILLIKKGVKIEIVKKKNGYFVGFGGLNESEIQIIAKLRLPNGTYKLDGVKDYLGIWTDDKGNIDIEKSRWFADFLEAYKWGKKRREKAI